MMSGLAGQQTDSLQDEILVAAASCFEERGYAATSIDDVARRLGATKGRIYHHFSSKGDLFAGVFRKGMEMNHAAVLPVREQVIPAGEKLRRMTEIHTRQMIETKDFQRVVWEGVEMYLRGSTTPEQRIALEALLESRSAYSWQFREVMLAARDEGDISFANLSIATQLMFMTLNSPIFWYSKRSDQDEDDIADLVREIVNFALRGLGASKELLK